MHRGWRSVVATLLVLLILNGIFRGGSHGRRAPSWPTTQVSVRYVPREASLVPSEWMWTPETTLRGEPPSEWSHGTAFSIDGLGRFITAAHVTRGCKQLALVSEQSLERRTLVPLGVVTEVVQHVSADASAVRTTIAAPPLAAASGALPANGMLAYGFGFPHGQPGAIKGEFMGRAVGRAESRPGAFPLFVWALIDRQPKSDQTLGGISGGPLVSAEGEVVGIVIGYVSERRSRFVSTTIAPVRDVSERGVDAITKPAYAPVVDSQFAAYGAKLRSEGSIVPIVCHRAVSTSG